MGCTSSALTPHRPPPWHPGDSQPSPEPRDPGRGGSRTVGWEGLDGAPPLSGWVTGITSFLHVAPSGAVPLPLPSAVTGQSRQPLGPRTKSRCAGELHPQIQLFPGEGRRGAGIPGGARAGGAALGEGPRG